MKRIMPNPKMLPIRISILIESKNNMKVDNLFIKPYSNINDILLQLEEYFKNIKNPILNWNKD